MQKAKKKRKKQKQKNIGFKLLLIGLISLLTLLVWGGINKQAASDILTIVPAMDDNVEDSRIDQVISPLLDKDTYVLTFEDELPEPLFEDKQPKKVAAQPSEKRHALALIIDDVGYDLHALDRLLALPYTLTVSILPDSPHAAEAARMAHQHGVKVMLHMPMQTSNPKYSQKMEKFYLHTDMSKEVFTDVFEAALNKVPYVEGINNHMGSLLTSDTKSMIWLMELCQKHGLFFIDSRTSAASVGAKIAQDAGIRWNERDVFLDHKINTKAIQKAWQSAISCVQRSDHCIILAHPHKETLAFLEQPLQGINPSNLLSITELLKH